MRRYARITDIIHACMPFVKLERKSDDATGGVYRGEGCMSKLATRAPATGRKSSGRQSDVQAAGRETGTVRRVLLLLSFLVDNPGASVNTIATHLNLPR